MIALFQIHLAPAISPPCSRDTPGGSSIRMRPRKRADQKNETASTPSAYGRAAAARAASDAVAGEERECTAPVHERVRLDVLLARHDIWIIAP